MRAASYKQQSEYFVQGSEQQKHEAHNEEIVKSLHPYIACL